MESPFISSIIHSLTTTNNSVLGFNLPYCERGEENSSDEELTEETAALSTAVAFLKVKAMKKSSLSLNRLAISLQVSGSSRIPIKT